MPPVLDAMEVGSPKKGVDGDVSEDPTLAKEEGEGAKADDEINVSKDKPVRGVTQEDFNNSVKDFQNGKNPEIAGWGMGFVENPSME